MVPVQPFSADFAYVDELPADGDQREDDQATARFFCLHFLCAVPIHLEQPTCPSHDHHDSAKHTLAHEEIVGKQPPFLCELYDHGEHCSGQDWIGLDRGSDVEQRHLMQSSFDVRYAEEVA